MQAQEKSMPQMQKFDKVVKFPVKAAPASTEVHPVGLYAVPDKQFDWDGLLLLLSMVEFRDLQDITALRRILAASNTECGELVSIVCTLKAIFSGKTVVLETREYSDESVIIMDVRCDEAEAIECSRLLFNSFEPDLLQYKAVENDVVVIGVTCH